MRSFQVTTTIACAPEAIWSVLMDTTSYPEWAVGTHRLEGEFRQGGVLKLFTVSKPHKAMSLTVRQLVAPITFTLSGGLPLGLFKGTRTFTLTPQPDGTTEFHMREVFTGPLGPLLGRMLPDLTPSFEAYAAGLKNRCES